MEARFEDERDALAKEIAKEQTELRGKFRERELRLRSIDTQQKQMIASVQRDVRQLETQRQQLVSAFRQVRRHSKIIFEAIHTYNNVELDWNVVVLCFQEKSRLSEIERKITTFSRLLRADSEVYTYGTT